MDDPRSGWTTVRLGQVVQLNKETTKNPVAEGLERYVGLEHLEPGDLRIRCWGDISEGTTFTNRFRPGHVLFGKRRAYQRKVAVADFDGVCSGDIYVFEPKTPEILLPELLPFICQTDAFFDHAVGTSAGSLSPRTNWKSLADYSFGLPPLAEQEKLVRLLAQARIVTEAAQKMARCALRVAEAFRESRMVALWETSERVPLPSACEVLTVGIVVTPAKYYVEDGGVPALRSLNVWPGRFVLDDLKRLSVAGHELHRKSELHAGDVAIVRTGDPGRPGNAAVIPEEMEGWNCIDLVLARPSGAVRSEYLEHFLNWTRSARTMQGLAPGTKQKHLSVKKLEHMEIAQPDLHHQDAFIEVMQGLVSDARAAEARASAAADVQSMLLRTFLGSA